MAYKHVLYTKDKNGLASMTFNRPEKLNALTWESADEVEAVVEAVKNDDAVRVLIVTGAGRAFSAGWDVDVSFETPWERIYWEKERARSGLGPPLFQSILKPVIAAVNGPVVGMAHEYMLLCDIRIASDRARFSNRFAKMGLVADMGAAHYFLPRLIGLSKACEYIFAGDFIDAQEAERIGLVNRVVPHEQLMPAAMELATRIARNAPLAIRMDKSLIYSGLKHDYEWTWNSADDAIELLYKTEDHQEGIRAFQEKREPDFKGK